MSDAAAAFRTQGDYLAALGGMLGRPRYRRPGRFFLWLIVCFITFWVGFIVADWMGGK